MSFALTSRFLGDVLAGLQPGLVHGLLQRALPDDDQRGLPLVDDVPELLDIGAGHATPQVAADPLTAAPTAAVAMIAGGNKMQTTAPTAAPTHAPCRVAISSLLTCTLPAASLVTTAAS